MRYHRNPGVVFNWVDNSIILMNQGSFTHCFAVEESGAFIWSSLNEPKSLETLVEGFVSQYGSSLEETTYELKKFIKELIELDLVHQLP